MKSAAQLLLDTARRGELHHAILVHGPRPQALRDLATRVAKTLNCLGGTTGDDCASCTRIDRRIHPDVHFVEVGGERKMISVEQIRELVAAATLRPYEGRNKVFIVDPADALSTGGSNSLLKTLEEPARDTTFILLTRSPDLLLPTIRSRSQPIYVGDDRAPMIGATPDQLRLQQIATFESEDEQETLARELRTILHRFAERRDSVALLAVASIVGGRDDANDAMALLAAILSSADEALDSIPRERRLAAADALLTGIRMLGVNADARLLVEGSLAQLVVEVAK
jgi:DNA polymerase III delta prime subunit